MKFYSTRNHQHEVSLQEAVTRGLPPDNGLYMPREIKKIDAGFLQDLRHKKFTEIAYTVAKSLIGDSIPDEALKAIVHESVTFPAPLVRLSDHLYILELFHGPSLAFKDFGARFMASLLSYFNRKEDKEVIILVATSGDTGGAVAAGFYRTPGVKVVILYPSGKVSPLQEKQLTTLGQNISALEIEGTFDDCQALVKKAFLDHTLNERLNLSSANSINIARLIPQAFYYFEAYKQLPQEKDSPTVFCVPSGNFGNLTACLLARKAGLPVDHIIAATNINDIVPAYIKQGEFQPKPSVPTISNAMDVGNPSNFARMQDLFGGPEDGSTWNNMRKMVSGYSFTDEQTRHAMRKVQEDFNYILDPHGAVGYLAATAYLKDNPGARICILETAHPSKFLEEVEATLNQKITIPERLARMADSKKSAKKMIPEFTIFKSWLLDNYS